MRNAAPETIDPRYPHPTESTSCFSGNVLNFYEPTGIGGEYWNAFGGLSGLKPNTVYQVVFVQNRLIVAGTLDQAQRILQGTVTTPDTLVPAPGT